MQQRNLLILFIIILIDQGSMSIVAPILPTLLGQITEQTLAQNSLWAGWLAVSYSAMQLIAAPFIGQLSDRYGRKLVLMLCMLVFAVDYLLMILANSVWLLLLGRLLSGIPGGSIVTAMAATADISDEKTRVKNFSMMYAAVGLGGILGPVVASLLVGYGVRVPFYFAMFSCLAAACWVKFFFVESFAPDPEAAASGSWREAFDFSLVKRPGFGYLFAGQFITFLGFLAPMILWSFYASYRFGWSAQIIGYSLSAMGITYFLVQSVVVKFTYPLLKTVKSIYLGFALYISGFVIIALTDNVIIFALGVFINILGSLSSSSATNIFSINVTESEQGRVQGLLSSVNSLAAIVGPPLISWLFYADVDKLHWFNGGLLFIGAAGLLTLGACFYYQGIKRVANKD